MPLSSPGCLLSLCRMTGMSSAFASSSAPLRVLSYRMYLPFPALDIYRILNHSSMFACLISVSSCLSTSKIFRIYSAALFLFPIPLHPAASLLRSGRKYLPLVFESLLGHIALLPLIYKVMDPSRRISFFLPLILSLSEASLARESFSNRQQAETYNPRR